jgi:hypothetical protein
MSALGMHEACTTACICYICAKRKVTCAPCMDCDGEYDTEESTREDFCNGYLTSCSRFEERKKGNA